MAIPGIRRVAFIRAIGPMTHKVMGLADLCEAFSSQGFSEPKSLLSTGNMFFTSVLPAETCKAKVAAIIQDFGLTLDVFVRDAIEMTGVVKASPFPKAAAERPGHMV